MQRPFPIRYDRLVIGMPPQDVRTSEIPVGNLGADDDRVIRVQLADEIVEVFQVDGGNAPVFRFVAKVIHVQFWIVPVAFNELADLFEQFRTGLDVFRRFPAFNAFNEPAGFQIEFARV